jgi:hypothetical protein
MHDSSDSDPIFQTVKFSVKDQIKADHRAKHLAIEWITHNSVEFFGLIPKNFLGYGLPMAKWNGVINREALIMKRPGLGSELSE